MTINISMKTVNDLCVLLTGFIFCLKNVLAIPHGFIKMFHLQQSRILDPPWCNNSCRTYQELGQGNFYSFDPEKVWFLSIYLLPTHKKKCNHENVMLTSISLTAFITGWTFIGLQKFWLLLSVIISSKLSTINHYFKILTFFIDEY